jgi:lipopolysaccharide export system protein LptC
MKISSRVRYWLPLLPLLGLLGATYWLNQQVQPESAKPDSKKRHDPDAIIENFTATKLNEQGAPNFIMAATKLLHYPDDDSTSLEVPHITMLSPGQPTIYAVARNGAISSKGDVVLLHDDVEVLREASPKQSGLTLQTDYLNIIPDQSLANTDRVVTIVDAHNIVRATGMEMNNKTRTLKLLSQVRSEHVPEKK